MKHVGLVQGNKVYASKSSLGKDYCVLKLEDGRYIQGVVLNKDPEFSILRKFDEDNEIHISNNERLLFNGEFFKHSSGTVIFPVKYLFGLGDKEEDFEDESKTFFKMNAEGYVAMLEPDPLFSAYFVTPFKEAKVKELYEFAESSNGNPSLNTYGATKSDLGEIPTGDLIRAKEYVKHVASCLKGNTTTFRGLAGTEVYFCGLTNTGRRVYGIGSFLEVPLEEGRTLVLRKEGITSIGNYFTTEDEFFKYLKVNRVKFPDSDKEELTSIVTRVDGNIVRLECNLPVE